MTRIRMITLSLLAVLPLGAVVSGTAQAAQPTRPTFWHFGAAVGGAGLSAEGKSGVSRLWATEVGVVVVCKEDTAAAVTLEEGGKDKAKEVVYKGCVPVKPEKNAHEQWEEGEPLANCEVKSSAPVGVAGEIRTNELASELVWTKTPETKVLTRFAPKTAALFTEIEVTGGATCALNLTKLKVSGSVCAWVPRVGTAALNEEATMGDLLFETLNTGAKFVVQRFTKWEVKDGTEALKEGTCELKLSETKKTQVESTEQVEASKVAGKRPLFEVHVN